MPVVLLVRHGQASFGAEDYDVLSEVGRRQAEVVGGELARRGLRDPLLVCGGLRRQRDTAALLGLGDPLVDARWDEYDSGDLLARYPGPEGPQTDAGSRGLQVRLDVALTGWLADPAGGWDAFQDGAVQALEQVARAGRDTVVVTSGGVVAAVTARLLRAGGGTVVALNRVTANGALTKVVAGRSGVSLVAFNDHAHFEADRTLLTYR